MIVPLVLLILLFCAIMMMYFLHTYRCNIAKIRKKRISSLSGGGFEWVVLLLAVTCACFADIGIKNAQNAELIKKFFNPFKIALYGAVMIFASHLNFFLVRKLTDCLRITRLRLKQMAKNKS